MTTPAPASDTKRPSKPRRRLKGRALVVVGVIVALVVLVPAALAFLNRGGGGDSAGSADTVRTQLVDGLADAQRTAQRADGKVIDVEALRPELEKVSSGWVVDLATTDDRATVGVAARKLTEPLCLLIWTAVGGPRTATVTDPNLPCDPQIALIAAR